MDRKSLSYLQSKVHEAQKTLETIDALTKAVTRMEEFEYTHIRIYVGEGVRGSDISLDFQGDRNELKKVLEKWRDDLGNKFSNL